MYVGLLQNKSPEPAQAYDNVGTCLPVQQCVSVKCFLMFWKTLERYGKNE